MSENITSAPDAFMELKQADSKTTEPGNEDETV